MTQFISNQPPQEMDALILENNQSNKKVDCCVIWLHGLGANKYDFVPIVEQLQLPAALKFRFIFPQAPTMAITVNQNMPMPAWYNILAPSITQQQDESGIRVSADDLTNLCEQQEALGIASDKIVLAGFSQGGAIALHCGCRYPKKLAGVMALSSYLPLPSHFNQEASATLAQTKIFIAHGEHDDVIPIEEAKKSKILLAQKNQQIQWQQYAMGHSVCEQEIYDIGQWLKNII